MGWGESNSMIINNESMSMHHLTYYCQTYTEMIRAGAVAKQVIVELESMGVDIKTGTTGDLADAAKAAFAGRTLDDYYTEGMCEHRDEYAL